MGHTQQSFFKTNWKHHLVHGGSLRRKRAGRGQRPLSTKEPLHVVFKLERGRLKHGSLRSPYTYALILRIIRRYAQMFLVKVDQLSVQGDHIHILVRAPRRAKFHYFFRVVAGQIAQKLEREALLNPQLSGRRKPATDSATEPAERRKNSEATGTLADPAHHQDISGATTQTPRQGTGLWKYRPFTRVARGYRAYKIVRDYVKLNELEAQERIPYRKTRLRGMSSADWEILWA